ncbi:MAG: T9SS type A sorting domain-containing protein [Bacteroidia bacterium]
MTKQLIPLFLLFSSLTANEQNFDWAKQYNDNFFRGISLSPEGNIYATGNKILAARLKPDGTILWQKKFADSYLNGGTIKAGNHGELYVCGTFNGTAELGDTTLKATVGEGFIAKLDTEGNILWIRQSTSANAAFNRLIVDDAGEVFLTGTFSGTDMLLGDKKAVGIGKNDAFLAKINAKGLVEWIQNLGTPGDDGIYDMEIASKNTILLSGFYDGAGRFGENKLPVKNAKTGFLATFNTNTYLAYFIQTDTSLFYQHISRKGSSYYFTAAFKDAVIVGGESFENTSPANTFDGLLIKTDLSKNPVWAKHIIGSAPTSLCVNKNESIITVGTFWNKLEIDDKKFTNKGESDIFMASYTADGNLDWVIQPSGANIDEMHTVCADTLNSVFYVLGAVQSGPVKLGNLDISGDFSGAPFMAKSKTVVTGITEKDVFYRTPITMDFYPNPATNTIHLIHQNTANTSVSITNMNGQQLYNHVLNAEESEINTQNLAAGLYIISFKSGNSIQSKLLQIEK